MRSAQRPVIFERLIGSHWLIASWYVLRGFLCTICAPRFVHDRRGGCNGWKPGGICVLSGRRNPCACA